MSEAPKGPMPGLMSSLLSGGRLWRLAGLLAAAFPIMMLLTLLVPYSVGVADGSLRPLLPTISEAGVCPLTAPLFGWLATLTAAVGAGGSLALSALLRRRGEPARWSCAVLVLGLTGAAATALAAGAPLHRQLSVHLSAVGVLGVCGGTMCLLLAVLTPAEHHRRRVLRWTLLAVGATMVAAFAAVQLAKPPGYRELQMQADAACNITVVREFGWRPGTNLFYIQLVIAVSEWSWLLMLGVFMATFADELWRQTDACVDYELLDVNKLPASRTKGNELLNKPIVREGDRPATWSAKEQAAEQAADRREGWARGGSIAGD